MAVSRATPLCTDGVSLVPVLRQPNATAHVGSYSQIPRGRLDRGMPGGAATGKMEEQFMGYTVRTTGWRYTEWHPFVCGRARIVCWSLLSRLLLFECSPRVLPPPLLFVC